jgi:lauroyl/myristoyl acyltransferase
MSTNERLNHSLRQAHQDALGQARLRAAALDLDTPGGARLDWLRFRVATQHFFPELAIGDAQVLYRENRAWRELKKFEFSTTSDLEAAGLLNLRSGRPCPGPAIYCAFHLGGWAVQPVLLLHRNIPLSIVTGPNVSRAQGAQWAQMNRRCLAQRRWRAELETINTDGQSALIQMMRQVRQGRSLYICLDGHHGARGPSTPLAADRHGLTVQMNGRALRVRQGAAFVAHQLGVPLVPMMSWREAEGSVNVVLGDPIQPAGEREAFAEAALQALWSGFAALAQAHGGQWEMAWDSYRSRPVEPARVGFEPQRLYRFNADRYHFFQPTQGLLLDAWTDEVKRVPMPYFGWLDHLRKHNAGIPGRWFAEHFKDTHALQQLIASELLVAQ